MNEDNFLENLVGKMAKALDKKDHGTFFSLKSIFSSLTLKNEDIKTPPPQIVRLADIQNSGYLKNAIKIDEYARRINHRWSNLSNAEKSKYISKKAKTSDSKIVFCGEKFAKDLEKKFYSLQKKADFVSRDAYYELMNAGYKAEKISIRKNSVSIHVLCSQEALVLKSKEDFERFVLQHENNFKWDIEQRMRA